MPKKKKNKIPTITEEEYERYVLSLKESEISEKKKKDDAEKLLH